MADESIASRTQAELPLPKPEARRPTVSIEDLQKFLRMYRIMAEEENGDRCRALYLAAIIEDLISAKAELAAKDARITDLEAESQRLRQQLAKDDDTQAEMAKRIAELEKDKEARKAADELNRQECSHWVSRYNVALGRAEAAESRLRAVSEALEEKPLPTSSFYPEFYRRRDVDSILTKLRAIVEGK